MIKICAGTKRLSSDPEDQPLLGDASAEFKVFLPKEKCQTTTGKDNKDNVDPYARVEVWNVGFQI